MMDKELKKELDKIQNFINSEHKIFIDELGGKLRHQILFNEFSLNFDMNTIDGHLSVVQMFREYIFGGVSTGVSTEISSWTSLEDFSSNLNFSFN